MMSTEANSIAWDCIGQTSLERPYPCQIVDTSINVREECLYVYLRVVKYRTARHFCSVGRDKRKDVFDAPA